MSILIFALCCFVAVSWVVREVTRRTTVYDLGKLRSRLLLQRYGFYSRQIVRPFWVAEEASESVDRE